MQTNNRDVTLPVNTTVNPEYSKNILKLWTDLEWRKVQAIFELDSFNPSHTWIADQLGMKVERVTEIVEGLLSLEIIKRTETGYELIQSRIRMENEPVYLNASHEQIIDVYSLLSKQAVNEVCPESYAGSKICVTASNYDLTTELYKDIDAAFKKFVKNSSESKDKSKVYAFTFCGANTLKGDK